MQVHKRVLVSLWSMNDQSTAQLMVKFYQKMLKDKLTPAAALRAAQLEMWQLRKRGLPFIGRLLPCKVNGDKVLIF